MHNAISYYNTHKNYKSLLYKNDVIASQYIDKPLLFNNKKLHLRLYYIVSYTNNIVNSFLLDFGKILTAKYPFDMQKPFTKDKHDSHFGTTIGDVFYPEAFTTEHISLYNTSIPNSQNNKGIQSHMSTIEFNKKHSELWHKCREICCILTKLIEQNNKKLLYSNEKNGYYIFGIDMMVDNTFTPKLIEVNEQSGYTCKTHSGLNILSKKIYEWVNATILEPLLKYNNPLIARQHKTYIAGFKHKKEK